MKNRSSFKFLIAAFLGATVPALAQTLQPTAVSVTPSSAHPGDSISVVVDVSNSGTTVFKSPDTADITVVFTNTTTGTSFTIANATVSPTGGLIGAATVDPTTNQTTPGTGSFTLSATVPTQTTDAGAFTARATINSVTAGTASGSYTAASPVFTVVGSPDFIITGITYPSSMGYVGGDVIPMTLTYVNSVSTGGVYNVPYKSATNKSNKPVRVQIVISSNPVYGDADDFQLTYFDIGDTQADGSPHTFSWNQLLPGNFAGSYYVLAKIDSLNVVDETGEAAAKPLETNAFLDVSGTKIVLQPTSFPTLYVASMAGNATAGGYSDTPSISADGRYTAFVSDATNLVSGDTNAVRDVFVYDNLNFFVRRVSVSQQGKEANGASNNPTISADGRYVAFASDATNLVFGDTNGFSDIFVVDVVTGALTRESLSTNGDQANGASFRPVLSSDGRYVVFESTATNLVSPSTPIGMKQIYRRDRSTGKTILVSQSTAGIVGTGSSIQAAVSGDGRYVAFASDATNLVTADTNAARDIFVRDTIGLTTARVSVGPAGTQAIGGGSRAPALSQDGRYVAYSSDATNLVIGDTNGLSDVFVYDRDLGTTVRVSVSSSGTQATESTDPSVVGSALGSFNPTISADGRYVAFASLADNLAPGDNVGQYFPGGSGNGAVNVYVMDRSVDGTSTFDQPGNINTTNVSVSRFGYQAVQILNIESTAAADVQPSISADGRFVAFPTDAEGSPGLIHSTTNLLSPDANSARDVIVFDRRINTLPSAPVVPTVNVTSPTSSGTYPVNSPIDVIATATTSVGSIASVQFFVNGTSLGTISAYPYVTTWTPTGIGTYTLSALATDSFGNQGVSNSVTVSVGQPAAPIVTITSPKDGSSIALNGAQTIAADATSPSGSVKSVQFFVNGAALGSPLTARPYSVTWSPTKAGAYTITATALDSFGSTTTSSPVTVMATPTAVPASTVYSGTYGSPAESGRFTLVAVNGTNGSLMAYSTTSPTRMYFFPALTISSGGAFSGTDTTGQISVSGTVSDTGANGTIDGSRLTFIGPVLSASSGTGNVAGYYTGSIAGNGTSTVSAIVGPDRTLTIVVVDGTYQDVGAAAVDSAGAFTAPLASGGKIVGKIDSATGFLSGTISGAKTGTVLAAQASGPSFSDGFLRNLSTRGLVGTGNNILIAGFVVAGDTPKNVLIRAIGPSLTQFGVDGVIGDPQLQLLKGSTPIAYNDDWRNDPSIAATGASVGAFPLNTSSQDAALLVRLDPGSYTAQVTGVSGATGVALVELYDVDNPSPYAAQKVMNVSTRGFVGTGQSQLIAGFAISGSIPKKVLIRAVGPSLATVGVASGFLADPALRLNERVNGADVLVRENDNWSQGNDVAMVTSAATKVSAFPLIGGSKDAVILATLPPGVYTAQVTGVSNATGIALVEVYEIQ